MAVHVAICERWYIIAVKKTVTVHPLVFRLHFLGMHSERWILGVWLRLAILTYITIIRMLFYSPTEYGTSILENVYECYMDTTVSGK